MKLSIDTTTDSKEDLQKVIQLLQMIVGKDIHTTNLQESILPSTDVSGLMSLFDQAPITPTQQAKPNPPAHAQDLTDPQSIPQIEFY